MEKTKTQDWKQIHEEFKASGLSVKKFAEAHGINYHALNYQVRKLRESNNRISKKQSEFVQIPVAQQSYRNFKPEITMNFEEHSVTIKVRFES